MLLYSKWRSVPLNTRIIIAAALGITKIGPTHVRDNYVESDGYKIEDVERIVCVENMQKYTGSTSKDENELWDLMVAKAEGREIVIAPPPAPAPVQETIAIEKPKRKYTKRAVTKKKK